MRILFLLLFPILAAAQVPQVSAGKIERHENFPSKFVAPRNVDVWLPPNFSPGKKYAVLYLHDGQMLFDSATTWNKQEWGVDETLSKLFAEGKIQPCIVVGIWNTPRRREEYFPAKAFDNIEKNWQDSLRKDLNRPLPRPLADEYLKFLVSELKPFIDKKYSTKRGRAHTFTGGASMGGLISLYAICEYPKVFGGAACLSTHFPLGFRKDETAFFKGLEIYLRKNLPAPKKHKIWFDFGTETLDAWYEPLQNRVDELMRGRGFSSENWVTRKFEGAEHSEKAWRARFQLPMLFLMGG